MAKCPACKQDVARLDSHHVIPLCYGGKEDGKQVTICQSCHAGVHSFERNEEPAPVHLRYLVTLVRVARKAYLDGATEARDSRKHVALPLTAAEEAIVDAMAVRFNTKGRPATIRALIALHARQMGLT